MPTVEERLASLEAKVDTMSDLRGAVTELRKDMNGRFVQIDARFAQVDARFAQIDARFIELRQDMNGRFDDVNRRLSTIDEKGDRHFTWMVSTQVALLLAVVGALVGAYYR